MMIYFSCMWNGDASQMMFNKQKQCQLPVLSTIIHSSCFHTMYIYIYILYMYTVNMCIYIIDILDIYNIDFLSHFPNLCLKPFLHPLPFGATGALAFLVAHGAVHALRLQVLQRAQCAIQEVHGGLQLRLAALPLGPERRDSETTKKKR